MERFDLTTKMFISISIDIDKLQDSFLYNFHVKWNNQLVFKLQNLPTFADVT